MRKTSFVVCLLAFSLLAQTKPEKDHTRYFPLTIGSEWEYVLEINGEEVAEPRNQIQEIKNGEYVDLELQKFLQDLTERRYIIKNYRVFYTGYGSRVSGGYKPFQKCPIILTLPLKVGLEWEYETDKGTKIFKKVVRWHEKFTTKYGNFNDVFEVFTQVNSEGINTYQFDYYAYGIGLILNEVSDDGRIQSKTLKSYTIK
ncbi:hypothetical protein MASR1M107_05210 [Ignavibacteriales bacterium]